MKTTISLVASRERQPQRLALAAAVVQDDARAVLDGDLARAIARVAVDDQHLVGVRLHLVDDLADQSFFVLGRDDNGDTECGHRLERWMAWTGGDPVAERARVAQRGSIATAARRGQGAARALSPYPLCYNRSAACACGLRDSVDQLKMLTRQIGLAGAILGANLRSPGLPYKVTFVATYHCNFRCEMCNIWQKKSVNEMTPEEVGALLRPLAAVPVGAPHRRRALHAPRPRRSRRRDSEELPVAVPAELPDHRLVRRQDRVARRADAGARRRPADGHHQHRRPEGAARGDARAARQLRQGARDVPAAARHPASRTSRP